VNNPRVGLITFGDARQHEWDRLFRGLTVPRHEHVVEYLHSLPIDLICSSDVARTRSEIDEQVDSLRAGGAESFVAHLPCWTSPNLVVHGVQRAKLPTVLLSNKHPGTHGTVGLLGAGGALDQVGYPHLRVRGEPEDGTIADKALPLFRAASTVSRLQGKVFGLFGGRSLGIDTGSIDPMQWRRLFGIDVEHIDQLEIIRRAEQMSGESAVPTVAWLERNVAGIAYDEERLTPARLSFQVRCYLATKLIIEEMGLDFVAVKCMPDLTNHYVPQCLSAALLPGPYDASGGKEPVAMSCEADGDGALTMEILKSVSGGCPTFFGDLSYINEETSTIYIPNCGGMCGWYAGRSGDPAQDLRGVELRPAFRPGGGATTYFRAAPGPVTLARLFRRAGDYHMVILGGEAVEPTPEEYETFVRARGQHQLPTMFVRVQVDFDELIDVYGANHISGVAGNYGAELEHVCHLLDIVPVVLG